MVDSVLVKNKFLNLNIANPLKNNSTFIYTIAGTAEVTIDILNMRKDLVYRMNIEKNAGEHTCFLRTFDMKGKGINPGNYIVEIRAESKDGKVYKEASQVKVIEEN